MGAAFNYTTRPRTARREDLVEWWTDMVERDRYENGHSYSGSWGMANGLECHPKQMSTEDKAHGWLLEHAQKWGPAIAVPTFDKDGKAIWAVGTWCSC